MKLADVRFVEVVLFVVVFCLLWCFVCCGDFVCWGAKIAVFSLVGSGRERNKTSYYIYIYRYINIC